MIKVGHQVVGHKNGDRPNVIWTAWCRDPCRVPYRSVVTLKATACWIKTCVRHAPALGVPEWRQQKFLHEILEKGLSSPEKEQEIKARLNGQYVSSDVRGRLDKIQKARQGISLYWII